MGSSISAFRGLETESSKAHLFQHHPHPGSPDLFILFLAHKPRLLATRMVQNPVLAENKQIDPWKAVDDPCRLRLCRCLLPSEQLGIGLVPSSNGHCALM